MMRKTAAVSALLLLFCVPANGIQTRWPHQRESGSYQAKLAATGKVLWRVRWETTVKQEDDRAKVEIHEHGEGQPWRSREPMVWQKKMLFREERSAVQVQSVTGSQWSVAGRPVEEMDFEADPVLKQILYKDAEAGKRPESVVLPWTPQSIPDDMLFHWIRTLPFEKAAAGEQPSTECTLVLSPHQQVRMKAQVKGREVVSTPAGTFSCYRVDLQPQLPGPLKLFAPRMTLWCRTDPPNVWVRYQGPIGGAGSPEAVIELVKFDQEG